MGSTSSQAKKHQEQDDEVEPDIVFEDDDQDTEGWRFSLMPRINRSRFLALLWLVGLCEAAAWWSAEYASIILARTLTIQDGMLIELGCHAFALLLLLYVAAMRFRDMNCSGSFSVALFVPLLNLFLLLLLILFPGSKHWNRFGASPRSSGRLTQLLGVYMPVLLIAGAGVAGYLHQAQVEAYLHQLSSAIEGYTGIPLSEMNRELLSFLN